MAAVRAAPAVTAEESVGAGRALTRLGRGAWNLVGIALAVALGGYVLTRVRVLVVALFAAMLLATVLGPAVRWLERHRIRRSFGTSLAFMALIGAVALAGTAMLPKAVAGLSGFTDVVSGAIDDGETWLVDGPLEMDVEQVRTARARVGRELADLAVGSNVLSEARAVAEAITGVILALALSFFLVKDGPALQRAVVAALPVGRREQAVAAGSAAWRTLVGYVRGMAILGVVEGTVMTVALVAVGADMAVPIGVLTVLCAFVPFVGAIVAGSAAVLGALVSGGVSDAVVIAVVALLLQQLDNEVLAPVVYGHLTKLHPVLVLCAVAGGSGVAGLAGAVLAVPLVATSVAAVSAARSADVSQAQPAPETRRIAAPVTRSAARSRSARSASSNR